MAFRKKARFILNHKPDILIVPECEQPEKIQFDSSITPPKSMLWFGVNRNKGLGIFSFTNFTLKLLRNYNPDLKMIIPVSVSGQGATFTLFAVWANHPDDSDGQYVEQLWKAIHHYNRKLNSAPIVIMGDFNSNSIWDRKSRVGNHSDVVKKLEKKGIVSCYHQFHKQEQGKESHPTFYLYKHKDKPYHIDYCFASIDFIENIQDVEIGEHDLWKQYSDHMPLIVTFSII